MYIYHLHLIICQENVKFRDFVSRAYDSKRIHIARRELITRRLLYIELHYWLLSRVLVIKLSYSVFGRPDLHQLGLEKASLLVDITRSTNR